MRDRFKARPSAPGSCASTPRPSGYRSPRKPYNNVVRTAVQALAAVLGGTNSLHTNSLDEALALPTAEAATLALRTQQIIAHESGVTDIVDPLGGSYLVERLTLDMEQGARGYFDTIDRMGGMVEAIEQGFPQREIAEASYRFQQAVERRDKVVVGVNDFVQHTSRHTRFCTSTSARRRQLQRLEALRKSRTPMRCAARSRAAGHRDGTGIHGGAARLRQARDRREMCDALRNVWDSTKKCHRIEVRAASSHFSKPGCCDWLG